MATTSKEGSRRVNYPIQTQGGSDKKSQCAAVIPAPIAYINVVAVKKLVVEVWVIAVVRLRSLDSKSPPSSIQ